MKPLRVFIGYDPRQPLAYTVAAHSAVVNCSKPVMVSPLILSQLPIERRGLTEFTYSRYLVPWLCNYEGTALFIDADTLVLGDLAELPWTLLADPVAFVPHERSAINGQNLAFERASVMLFNCGHDKSRRLTPEYVEAWKPQTFDWANHEFTRLGHEWNHLVGYDAPRAPNDPAKIVHFTQGIPCFDETMNDEYATQWKLVLESAIATVPWEGIMGGSIHAQYKKRPFSGHGELLTQMP